MRYFSNFCRSLPINENCNHISVTMTTPSIELWYASQMVLMELTAQMRSRRPQTCRPNFVAQDRRLDLRSGNLCDAGDAETFESRTPLNSFSLSIRTHIVLNAVVLQVQSSIHLRKTRLFEIMATLSPRSTVATSWSLSRFRAKIWNQNLSDAAHVFIGLSPQPCSLPNLLHMIGDRRCKFRAELPLSYPICVRILSPDDFLLDTLDEHCLGELHGLCNGLSPISSLL